MGVPFHAAFDPAATWFDDLEPAFGEREFFFTQALQDMKRVHHGPASKPGVTPRRLPLAIESVAA